MCACVGQVRGLPASVSGRGCVGRADGGDAGQLRAVRQHLVDSDEAVLLVAAGARDALSLGPGARQSDRIPRHLPLRRPRSVRQSIHGDRRPRAFALIQNLSRSL